MNPWRRLGLAHPESASMEPWRGMLLEREQNEQQSIFRGGQGTVLIGRLASRLPPPSMERPFGHVPQERCLKGGHQRRKLVHGHARQIQDVGRMGGKIARPEQSKPSFHGGHSIT